MLCTRLGSWLVGWPAPHTLRPNLTSPNPETPRERVMSQVTGCTPWLEGMAASFDAVLVPALFLLQFWCPLCVFCNPGARSVSIAGVM